MTSASFVSAPRIAAERGLQPRYVIGGGEIPEPGQRGELYFDGVGPFVVEGLPRRWGLNGEYRLASIVESPSLEGS